MPLINYDNACCNCDCSCGPVGAFTALLLCRYGLSVIVIEAETSAYSVPRAIAVDDEIVRLLGLGSTSFSSWMDQHVFKAPVNVRTGTYTPRYGSKATAPGELRGWSIVGPDPPITVGKLHALQPSRVLSRRASLVPCAFPRRL